MNFEMTLKNWNMVEEVGLPADDEYIIAIHRGKNVGYAFQEGSYYKKENIIRNTVFGEIISMEGERIIAWLPMFSGDIDIRKI